MNSLLNCVQNEIAAMTDLVQVLQHEQKALTEAPTLELMEEINRLTQKKQQLIATVSELNQLRQKELRGAGFDLTQMAELTWLTDQELTTCWTQFTEQTEKANELNRVNGLLLSRHLALNQSTLDVLSQRLSESNPALYGSNGQTNTQRGNVRGITA